MLLRRIQMATDSYVGQVKEATQTAQDIITELELAHRSTGLSSIDKLELSGKLDILPVFEQKSDGRLYINIPGIGLGVVIHNTPDLLLTYWDCPAGMTFDTPHFHSYSNETFIILEGTIRTPDFEHVITSGSAYVIPPNTSHVFRADTHVKMFVSWTPALSLDIREEDSATE